MRLITLELRNFRNHRDARTSLGGASTLLLGENGSGKTSWMEAAVLLSVGRSFRGARDQEIARRGADGYEVRAVVKSARDVQTEICAIGSVSGAREVRVDGAPLARFAELLGRFPTVHFSVEDVGSLNGPPAGRRRFLDVAICQIEPAYVAALREYTAALKQRNRLLIGPGGPGSDREFDAWEEILARTGVEIDRRREAIVRDLQATLGDLAAPADESLRPEIRYEASGGPVEAGAQSRAERLRSARGRDRRLTWTSEGPHRAAIRCAIEGDDLKAGVSRGYTRLYSIFLRLALARVLEERLGDAPVVLLDDPESELDERWMDRMLHLVPEASQVIVTSCRPLAGGSSALRSISIESLERVGRAA